jgi:hypothetical protein
MDAELEITDDQLSHLCTIVGIDLGTDKGATCRTLKEEIGSQGKRRKTGLTKAKLQPIADQMGLGKVWTIEHLLSRLETRKDPRKEAKEDAVVLASLGKSVNTISCTIYEDRFCTIVPIPKIAFNTQKPPRWLPTGGVSPGYLSCINCGFFKSSGKSNEGKNFQGMWFPFLRVKETEKLYDSDQPKGWIHKAYNLSTAREFKTRLSDTFKIPITEFLDIFLEKYSHWWQIQISAALPSAPDSHWNTHPELIRLKAIVLNFDYIHLADKPSQVWQENPKIIKEYRIPECTRRVVDPKEVNIWLAKNSALCVEKD